MNAFFLIGAIFSQCLLILIGVLGGVFLVREYLRRKQRHLLLFAGAYFSMVTVFICAFITQLLSTFVSTDAALVTGFAMIPTAVICFSFVLAGILEVFSVFSTKTNYWLSALLCASALLGVSQIPRSTIDFNGLVLPFLSLQDFYMMCGPLIVATVVMIGGTAFAGAKRKTAFCSAAAYRTFRTAGFYLVLYLVIYSLAIITESAFLNGLGNLTVLVAIFNLFFAAVAVGADSERLSQRPTEFFTRSLLFKSASIVGAIFWVVSLVILGAVTNYFAESSAASREAALNRDVHFYAGSYASYSALLLEQTSRLAERPDLADFLSGRQSSVSGDIQEFLSHGQDKRIFRIVSPNGTILYSSISPQEIGQPYGQSDVITEALSGKKTTRTEREKALGVWMLRAAVPVRLSNGRVVGVVLGTDLTSALDFAEYASLASVVSSGYGYISRNGDQILGVGGMVDGITKLEFAQAARKHPTMPVRMDGGYFAVENVMTADGGSDGFFYTFLTDQRLNAETLRIISFMILIVLLLLFIVTAILVFSMAIILRPIKQLRAAAHKVEKGDYDVSVDYRSPDELGELATAFNRMSATIGERTKKLTEAVREEKDFISHSASEMRSPLNIFRWTIELMRFGDTGTMTKEQNELLEQLNQTTLRLQMFVGNLSDVAALEEGKLPFKREFIDVRDVIDEAAGELAVKIREKNINLHWKHDASALPKAYADHERLLQTIINLLSNAVKYTPNNGHIEMNAVSTKEKSPGGAAGNFIRVTIEDNGFGIPKEEHDRVFTRFFRSKNVLKNDFEGTGLGLFITKALIEAQGGAVWFTSEEGSGTTMYFTIPTEKR